jgi:hypothetical protein
LGPLHLEVFLQRLQQEYAASVISTAPTVPYELDLQGAGDRVRLESIADYPRNTKVRTVYNQTERAKNRVWFTILWGRAGDRVRLESIADYPRNTKVCLLACKD